MKKLIFALAVFLAVPAMATQPLQKYARYGEVVALTALSAASSSFEIENIQHRGTWGLAVIYVNLLDADDGVSAINMTCTASTDDNTTDYMMPDCPVSAGTATCTQITWVFDPSGHTSADNKYWVWRVDIEGYEDFECTFTDTGGDGSDFIQVELAFATKG